jgi:hypothetical protein
MDGHGFTPQTWRQAAVFSERCATPHDVDGGAAVYALTETWNARPLAMPLPQPVIWWQDEAEERGALAVQAESHETDDGETMQVLGLLLPDGTTAVSLLEDVDLVDATDPVWRALVETVDGEDEDGSEGWDELDAGWDHPEDEETWTTTEQHGRLP